MDRISYSSLVEEFEKLGVKRIKQKTS